jgi:hypothetical protein
VSLSILCNFSVTLNKLQNAVNADLVPVHVIGLAILDKDALWETSELERFACQLVVAGNQTDVDLV